MPIGTWTWFDKSLEKVDTLNLLTDTLKIVLTSSSQALSRTFVGASGDCRYSDLTAELTTAGGYTAGGQTLTGPSSSRSSNVVTVAYNNPSWVISSSITFKYAAIVDDTLANDNLLAFLDTDTGGGSSTVDPAGSPLAFTFLTGLFRYTGA